MPLDARRLLCTRRYWIARLKSSDVKFDDDQSSCTDPQSSLELIYER